jgi:hypothetical protein
VERVARLREMQAGRVRLVEEEMDRLVGVTSA